GSDPALPGPGSDPALPGPGSDPALPGPGSGPAPAPNAAPAPAPTGTPAPGGPDGHGDTGGHGGTWSLPEQPHAVSWPHADATAPAPGAGARWPGRRIVWSVLGGAAAAGIATALVLTLVVADDGDGDGKGRASGDRTASAGVSPSPEPSATGTEDPGPSPGGTATPTGPAPSLPAEYEVYTDPEGFTLARPAGWRREAVASQYGMDVVSYRSADGERRLQVFEVAEASPEESFELFLSEDTPKAKGFEQLSLETLDDGDFTGTRLEYLAASFKGEPDVGPWHVVDVRFRAADGKVYALAAYGPDADGRDDERELAHTALGHFCPPYTECGTDAGPV
ncbi:hypothetical protein, partial [Streptomyces sp. NPDC006134]|uniref:hypothetical protein n=1 Tax=Streptomyces sp. NPDC006134 TaxID=3154467 RepID=UPI0033EA2F3E